MCQKVTPIMEIKDPKYVINQLMQSRYIELISTQNEPNQTDKSHPPIPSKDISMELEKSNSLIKSTTHAEIENPEESEYEGKLVNQLICYDPYTLHLKVLFDIL